MTEARRRDVLHQPRRQVARQQEELHGGVAWPSSPPERIRRGRGFAFTPARPWITGGGAGNIFEFS